MVTPRQRSLLVLCALRDGDDSVDWSLIAREATRPTGLDEMLDGLIHEQSAAATKSRPALKRLLDKHREAAEERVEAELEAAAAIGARLTTVLDEDYPPNLRLVSNLPPFLFMRGLPLEDADLRSIAVVGTRQASDSGRRRAERLARELVHASVTVVSGLAAGIDTCAHTTALEEGGRTVAVIGTGVTKSYPKQNADLAEQIAEKGIIVSQFWPSTGPARWTFPRRNVVMSGIAQGTVVVEASSTSGAKMQARLALEHGKKAFLLRTLVTDQPWAQKYIADRGAIEVADIGDVLSQLALPERVRAVTEQRQLTLDLV